MTKVFCGLWSQWSASWSSNLECCLWRFARMCMEAYLAKTIVGRVGIKGQWYQVQYMVGLHIICMHWGCYNHVMKEWAPSKEKQKVIGVPEDGMDDEPARKRLNMLKNPANQPTNRASDPANWPTNSVGQKNIAEMITFIDSLNCSLVLTFRFSWKKTLVI